MKKHLQRILSLLCVLALALGTVTVLAEEDPSVQYETRVIIVKWADGDNYDGIRPTQVEAELARQKVTLNAGNNWTASVSVPAGTDNEWNYNSAAGYTPSLSKDDISVLTYSHAVAPTISVSGSVDWDDNDNTKGIRPDHVTLMLLADGTPCGEPQAAKDPGWKVTWTDLPPYGPDSDIPIKYTVKQLESVPGYTTSGSGESLTVKNQIQTGTLKVRVTVSGAPEDADLSSLHLIIDGPEPGMPYDVVYGQSGNGTRMFTYSTVLPGAYLVREDNADTLVEGYTMDKANSKVVDAVYVGPGEEKTLEFKYAWKLPESIKDADPEYDPWSNTNNLSITILGPDSRTPYTVSYAQFEKLTDSTGRLVLNELSDLTPGVYTVVETNAEGLVQYYNLTSDSIAGVKLDVAPDATATAKLYNQYVPAPTPEPEAEFVDIPVTKTWNDSNNKSITVRLYADGVEVDSHVLTAAENWAYTFTEKPRFQDDFKTEIVYTVNEDPGSMYNTKINGYNIVNDYSPEVTSVSVTKVWVEPDGDTSKRPSSIGMTLSDGQKNVTVVILNRANNWTATVNNLPTVVNGVPAKYAWKEQGVLNYTLTKVEQNGSNMTFTNTRWTPPGDNPPGKPPKNPGDTWYIFEEYDTPLGVEVVINHVGDCFD